ncbi:GreA/GreB family elongation factor [Sphingomonas lenta]|uniref:Nucleoside-diphosphate kinase n=1 Tax=Sphingomonas lenta TaxID=1141887 RepID=A0A2A2SK99_9SPHN|nr:GreA/GreB family elongation factor [Sphingomonas lenta]PAX09649.1 nucleoside-diphosphate kinase [Sphingomonas lenta]
MSVAFRRESDEEHLEPKFELPIPPGPNLVTPRGKQLIDAKVEELEAAVAAEADEPRRQSFERDLRYWRTRRATAELAEPPAPGEVGIGSRVTFRQGTQARTIEIVGTDEADPATGRIGFQAPLARVLLGAVEGERVDFNGVVEALEILEVASDEKA